MAKKFHINGEGKVGRCHVTESKLRSRGCPFGAEEDHFGSPEEAREAYERKMESEAITEPQQKSAHPLAGIPDLGTRRSSKTVRLTMEAVDGISEDTLERWRNLDQNTPQHSLARNIDDFNAGGYTEGVLANLATNHGTVAYSYADKDLRDLVKEKADIETAQEINALHDRITNRNREILEESGIDTYEGFKVKDLGFERVEVEPGRREAIDGKIAEIKRDLPAFKKFHEAWKAIGTDDAGSA